MGKLVSGAIFLSRLVIVAVLTLVSMFLTSGILELNPAISPGFVGLGMILSFLFFGAGLFALVFKNSWTVLKYSGPLGLLSIAGIYVAGIIFSFLVAYGLGLSDIDIMCYAILAACCGLFILDYYTGWITGASHQERVSFKLEELERDEIESIGIMTENDYVGAIEIVNFPESHLTQQNTPEKRRMRIETTEKIIRGLRLAEVPFALRLESVDQKIRLFYLTWATNKMNLVSRLERLESTLRIHLHKFGLRTHATFEGLTLASGMKGYTGQITGEPMTLEEPQQRIYCLGTVVDVLKTIPNGIVQIFVMPASTSWSKCQLLKRQVDRERRKSQVTIAYPRRSIFSGTTEQSFTQVDLDASSRLAECERALRRHEANDSVKLAVTAVCWDKDEQKAKRTVKVLIEEMSSTIVPASKKHDFKPSYRSGQQRFRTLLKGKLVGNTSLLIPEEAAAFLVLPKRDIGIQVIADSPFLTNPGNLNIPTVTNEPNRSSSFGNGYDDIPDENSIILGHIMDDRGIQVKPFRIHKNDLTSHVGIWGDIGRGKTTTTIKMLIDLWKLGVNWLVFIPSKNDDYVELIRQISDLRIFTPGNETLVKLRINPFDFAEEVTVNQIINRTMHIYVAAFPCYGMIKGYLEDVIEMTFERLGWDRKSNKRGLSVLPSDFLDTVPLLKLDYSTDGKQDFKGALLGRLRGPLKGALVHVFNTLTGISIEELVSHPTLFLMDDLKEDDEKSLFTYLMLENLAMYFESRKKVAGTRRKGLQHMIVFEEAHRLLAGDDRAKTDEEHGAHTATIQAILQTMQEGRSSGLGMMAISQRVNQLPLGAIELPQTHIVHSKMSESDRKLLGFQMNCNDAQIKELGSLPSGYIVVKAVNYRNPVKVQVILSFVEHAKLRSDENVTNDEIKAYMNPVLRANPHFVEGLEIPSKSQPQTLLIGINCNLNMHVLHQIFELSRIELWKKIHKIIVKHAQNGDTILGAINVLKIIEKLVTEADDLSIHCDYFVWFLSQQIPDHVEAHAAIREELIRQLSLECTITQFERTSLDWFHKRMNIEALKRVEEGKIDTNQLMELLKEALLNAKAEYDQQIKAMEEAGIDFQQIKKVPLELDYKLAEFVSRERFGLIFTRELETARAGDFKPLAKIMNKVTKRLTPDEANRYEIMECLIDRCIEKYGSPSDSELVKGILSEVKAEMSA